MVGKSTSAPEQKNRNGRHSDNVCIKLTFITCPVEHKGIGFLHIWFVPTQGFCGYTKMAY